MKKALTIESPDERLVTFDMCSDNMRCDGVITVIAAGEPFGHPRSLYIVATIDHHTCTSKMLFNQQIVGIGASDSPGGPGIVIKFKDGIAFEDQIAIDEIDPNIIAAFQKLFGYQMERVGEGHDGYDLNNTDCTWIGGTVNASRN